jgi:two-component system, response regulator PdtaR
MTCSSEPTELPRVLVVDDEAVLRRELTALLSEEGFTIVGEANDGLAAVAACANLQIDVVLMDLRMPEMNGLDATRVIRNSPRPPAVVLLSAYDDAALKESAADAGAFAYLVKGCPADEILASLELAAAQTRGHDDATAQ